MKRATKIKILVSILCIAMLVFWFSTSALAFGPEDLDIQDVETDGLASWAGKVMGIIRNVSIIASVIILMVIGVKFILGSVDEKAKYKESLVPILIGIALVVGATTIATFIFNNAAIK